MLKELSIRTEARDQFVDITHQVRAFVQLTQVSEGLCYIYVPHTTAGVTINENADPDVRRDIIKHLNNAVPWVCGYQHLEGNSAAHIKASMMGFSQVVIIQDGKLLLGTWQGVYFCEFDGPRNRKVFLKVVSG